MQENVLLAYYTKYGHSTPGGRPPENECLGVVEGFLNYPQTLSLSQVMQENVILAYYAQI